MWSRTPALATSRRWAWRQRCNGSRSSCAPQTPSIRLDFVAYRSQSPSLEERLYLICREALSNAISPFRRGSAGRRAPRVNDDVLMLSIQDNGRGFDVAARAEVTGDSPEQGIGLQTMSERAATLGGVCEVQSQSGRGTTVVHSHSAAGDSMTATIKLLLVDDHGIVREGLRALLDDGEEFVIVGEAGNGDEACDAVRRLHPDIVLMDLKMPGMAASDAIRVIRATSPAVKVIALTSYAEDGQVREIMAAGAAGYILKDVSPSPTSLPRFAPSLAGRRGCIR